MENYEQSNIDPERLKQAKLATLVTALSPLCSVLAILLAVLAVLHLFLLDPPFSLVQSGITGTVAAYFVFTRLQLRFRNIHVQHVEWYLLAGLAGLIFDNAFHLIIANKPIQFTSFAMMAFGHGLLAITPMVFGLGLATIVGFWGICMAIMDPPATGWTHFYVMLGIVFVVSIAFYVVRVRVLHSWQTAKLILEDRTRQLESALTDLERADEIKQSRDQLVEEIKRRVETERQLRTAKEQAENASRLKDAILAAMSHEIRTPMTAILGFSELLSKRLTGSSEGKHAELIYVSGKRLMELLNNIIDLARLEANEMPIHKQAVRAADPIRHVVSLWGALAEQKGIRIEGHVAEDLYIDCDPRRLEQILNNLVNNAIRYTEKGGIEVIAHPDEDQTGMVRLEVRDTGKGMAKEFIPKAFKEFQQQEIAQLADLSGSGLGLALCKRLCEKMDGTIEIESQVGIGTTVVVRLPQAESTNSPGTTEDNQDDTSAHTPHGPRLTVLLLEDDDDCRRLVHEIIHDQHQIVEADNGHEAIALAKDTHVDVLLLDINLNDEEHDGISVLREIRTACGRPIPAIALTAYAMKGDRSNFLAAGFNSYLAKPFEPDTLLQELARIRNS